MADGSGMPVTLALGRSAQSGNYTLTAAWQTIYSDSDTAPYIFYGGQVDLSNMVDGDVVDVRVRKTMASGGAWITISQISYAGLRPIGNKAISIASIVDVYGLEVSIRQSLVFANFIVISAEWFPGKRPLGV